MAKSSCCLVLGHPLVLRGSTWINSAGLLKHVLHRLPTTTTDPRRRCRMLPMILARMINFHLSHNHFALSRTSQSSPAGMTCIDAAPSTCKHKTSSSSFLAVSSLVTPKSRFRNSLTGTLNENVSAMMTRLMTLITVVLAILRSGAYCRTWV
jgi:hypothetical protein